jgi:hypothetical protein
MKSWNLNFLESSGPFRAPNGTALHYVHAYIYIYIYIYNTTDKQVNAVSAKRALTYASWQSSEFSARPKDKDRTTREMLSDLSTILLRNSVL